MAGTGRIVPRTLNVREKPAEISEKLQTGLNLKKQKGLICLQFIVKDRTMVPPTIMKWMPRKQETTLASGELEPGIEVMGPTNDVCADKLFTYLMEDGTRVCVGADYIYVDGGIKWRVMWATHDQARTNIPNFENVRDDVLKEAKAIIFGRGCRTRIDVNHLFFKQKKVVGKTFILVGTAMKMSFSPKFCLAVLDGEIALAPVPMEG